MAMRTAAKSISRRLFSGARNFSEKAESHNLDKVISQLAEKVEKLSTEMKSLKAESHNIDKVIGQLAEEVENLSTEMKPLEAESHNIDKVFWQLPKEVEKLSTEMKPLKAESHNFDKVFWQLAEEVEKLSTEMKSLKHSYRYTIEVANSNRTYLDVTKTRLCVLGCASAMGGYYWGTTVKDDDFHKLDKMRAQERVFHKRQVQ